MIDDTLITRVFENIINNGELVKVTNSELVFKVGEIHTTIIISNETEGDEKITNTPLSVDKLTKWHPYPWAWSVHRAIKPGVLLVYQIRTDHNNYIVKPKLSKQEEYKEIINKHLHEFELNYLQSLL